MSLHEKIRLALLVLSIIGIAGTAIAAFRMEARGRNTTIWPVLGLLVGFVGSGASQEFQPTLGQLFSNALLFGSLIILAVGIVALVGFELRRKR
jgi:hypothetical protein